MKDNKDYFTTSEISDSEFNEICRWPSGVLPAVSEQCALQVLRGLFFCAFGGILQFLQDFARILVFGNRSPGCAGGRFLHLSV